MSGKIMLMWCSTILITFFAVAVVADSLGYVDEEEKRRVDISLTIFPRIVAVDNDFRSKLNGGNKVHLVFLYIEGKSRARSLSQSLKQKNKNIGGMRVRASAVSLDELLISGKKIKPTAIFISEHVSDDDLNKILAYSRAKSWIVFSPFVGDVERGVTVGISITNRVKPYFNLSTLKESGIVINALLMKMSKRYE
ncbi:MAG: hypothetical protein V3R49_06085 [Gammaproteobacteria bacterium]